MPPETIIEVNCSTGEQVERPMTPAEEAALAAARVVVEPPPSKNDILLSLLDGLEPGDEATEVMLLVVQELLRP